MAPALAAAVNQVAPTLPPVPTRAPFARVQLAVENRSAFCYLPLTIAERLGYFATEGLDVQVRELPEPGHALQALLNGSVQVLSGPYSASITARARGQSFPSIVVQGRTPQLVLGVSRKSMAGFRDLRDLRGRKLAVTAMGSAGHRMILTLMANARMEANAVQLVPLSSPTAALANFRNGLVDAMCYTDPVITQLEQDGALRVVADTRTVRGNAEVFGGPMPAGCLSVSTDYLTNHGAECQAMVDAMVRALKWLQTAGPSDINKTVPEGYFQGDRALYLAAFSRAREAWTPDGLMPEGGPATMARVLSRLGEAPASLKVDLSQTYTNVLALKAKARFRL
jgi:NitT/TauT family transport system substrate-binding protein